MFSLPWIEKYRPKTLDEVVDQEEVISSLKSILRTKAIPHMLFTGPPGVGKTATAHALARDLYGPKYIAQGLFLEINASVTPDTPIMIRKNDKIERTTIGELANEYFNNNSKYAFPKGLEVLSIDKDLRVKFMPVGNISRHKTDKIAIIKFEGGEVKTTLSHSLIILDEECNLKEVKVSELKEGDLLISFKTKIEGSIKDLDLRRFAPKKFIKIKYKRKSRILKNPTVKNIINKIKINEDFAWLLGNFLAEGCIGSGKTNKTIIFTYGYPQENLILSKASSIISSIGFSTSNHIIRSGSSNKNSGIQLMVSSTQLARFFEEFFYKKNEKKIAKFKKIPNFVFEWPIELRHSFLKGYLGDASGNWNEYIRYTSASKDALIDTAWLGRISELETSIFKKEARIIWNSFPYRREDLIPVSPLINFLEKLKGRINFNWRYLLRHQLYAKKSKRLRKKLAEEILKKIEKIKLSTIEKSQLEKLKKLINSDLHFVKIKKINIEQYNDYVYDISVPGSEMFFGGSVPILLHNSDERGIQVIREKVKTFARSVSFSDVGFRILLLDESDQLTPEAQHSLRRTMELYSSTCRFILAANYSNRIIEPIQSRCAIFRFKPLQKDKVVAYLRKIAEIEKIEVTDKALEEIYEFSEGDLRKCINALQAASTYSEKIDEKIVYKVFGQVNRGNVRKMIELALANKFEDSLKILREILYVEGTSSNDLINALFKEIMKLNLPDEKKLKLIDFLGEIDYRISEGATPEIQLMAFLTKLVS
jgi:replication factor C small subunit